MTFGETGRSGDKYVPVISGVEHIEKHGIHLFLKLKEKDTAEGSFNQPGTYEGMLHHGDLPGPLRVELERRNAVRGNDHYVMQLGKTPTKMIETARVMMMIA